MGDETPRLVVALSDLHCGGSTALCPPKVDLVEAGEYHHNAIQGYIWSCWQHFHDEWLPEITGGDPHVLLCNGDIVEGFHHGTVELVSHDVTDHVAIAMECLREPVSRAEKTYIVRGTETHVKNTEHSIGKALGAEQDPRTRRHCWDHLRLEINGSIVAANHHMPATKRNWLKASQMSLEATNELVEWALAGEKPAQCYVRSHRHVYGMYDEGRYTFVVLPSWQHSTRFVQKVVPGALNLFGGVVLDFRNTEPGEPPTVRKKLYPALAAKEVVV